MFSQDDDSQQGLALTLVFGLVALVTSLVVGMGIYKNTLGRVPAKATPEKTAAVKAVAAIPEAVSTTPRDAAQAATDAASVKVENGVVKFYFASGKADLSAGAGDALLGLIQEAGADRKLVISGFHDATGDAGKNAELALQRALAVRDALKAVGVTGQQIVLEKPKQMSVSGDDAQARRVEVKLQ